MLARWSRFEATVYEIFSKSSKTTLARELDLCEILCNSSKLLIPPDLFQYKHVASDSFAPFMSKVVKSFIPYDFH